MKVILFDMMDTLVEEPFPKAILWLLQKAELSFEQFQSYRNPHTYFSFEKGEIGEYEFFRDYYMKAVPNEMKKRLPRPEKIKKELYKQKVLFDGIEEIISKLIKYKKTDDSLRLGIASNYSVWYTIFLKKFLELEQAMDYMFFSCEMNVRKPHASFYERIEESVSSQFSASRLEILFIDDQMINLEVPQKMGWETFLMKGNCGDMWDSISHFLKSSRI